MWVINISVVAALAFAPVAAWLTDTYGAPRMALLCYAANTVVVVPAYYACLHSRSPVASASGVCRWCTCHGGPSGSALAPTPSRHAAAPRRSKTMRRSGSHFASSWRSWRREILLAYGGGYKFVFTPRVYTQNAEIFMVNPNMPAKHEFFSDR